jgi:hypothetical protein
MVISIVAEKLFENPVMVNISSKLQMGGTLSKVRPNVLQQIL